MLANHGVREVREPLCVHHRPRARDAVEDVEGEDARRDEHEHVERRGALFARRVEHDELAVRVRHLLLQAERARLGHDVREVAHVRELLPHAVHALLQIEDAHRELPRKVRDLQPRVERLASNVRGLGRDLARLERLGHVREDFAQHAHVVREHLEAVLDLCDGERVVRE